MINYINIYVYMTKSGENIYMNECNEKLEENIYN